MKKRLMHAYEQAPWRLQIRNMSWVLLVIVAFVVIAITSLNISAKTYAAGIDIQGLEREKEIINHNIADMKNELGSLTSFETMSQRAADKGYVDIDNTSQIVYLSVSGYQRPALELDIPNSGETNPHPIIKPAYSHSLWDLFLDGALKLRKFPER